MPRGRPKGSKNKTPRRSTSRRGKHEEKERAAAVATATRTARQPVRDEDDATPAGQFNANMSKDISALVAHVQKKCGDDIDIERLDEAPEEAGDVLPTGIASLDDALGIGGWPSQKVVQVSGPESVGKSALCKMLIARAQRSGYRPVFIDGELSKDTPERYRAHEIDTSGVAWSETLYIEDAFSIAEQAILFLKHRKQRGQVFMDSIAAFESKAQRLRAFDEEGRRAWRASYLSENFPKLVHLTKNSGVGLVVVNQMRQRANAMPFQDPNYEPGGFALRHFSHVIIRMARVGTIKASGEAVGIKSKLNVRKNKLAPPFKQAFLAVYFDGRIEETDGTRGDE